ncbi:hypothetical protein ACFVWR_09990 [Leifsonia sp. NPDC058292]|uniref:hypothetical protein n=1 Tax=Leifsonia sp. NPDC058292 TaxID=3346428 RepID=UPI0036DBC0D3
MTPTEPDGAGPNQAGTPADPASAGASAAPGAAETISAARPQAENTGIGSVDGDGDAESTDRPGDIPFDQAAAEHENPALE